MPTRRNFCADVDEAEEWHDDCIDSICQLSRTRRYNIKLRLRYSNDSWVPSLFVHKDMAKMNNSTHQESRKRRPLHKKHKKSEEKLPYIHDSVSELRVHTKVATRGTVSATPFTTIGIVKQGLRASNCSLFRKEVCWRQQQEQDMWASATRSSSCIFGLSTSKET